MESRTKHYRSVCVMLNFRVLILSFYFPLYISKRNQEIGQELFKMLTLLNFSFKLRDKGEYAF